MDLKEGWEYYPVWTFASPLNKINCGFIKCFFCTQMEELSPDDRKSLFIEELNTYKCLKYPEGIPQEIIIEKADIFEDMFHHPYCEHYDRCSINVKERTKECWRRRVKNQKNNPSNPKASYPPWVADIIKEIEEEISSYKKRVNHFSCGI